MSESWTTKYSPKAMKDFVGNINVIKDGTRYLKQYKSERSPQAEFPKAILISGPPGTGKTEFAKQLSIYRGYIPIEFSAALLRKKEEIQNCIDIYVSDVRQHFGPNNPLVIQALTNLDSTNMVKLGVGKSIIIDELDATSKGYKGLVTALMDILKSTNGHNPNNIIIFTCDESTLANKLKTLSNQCYQLKFKPITDREMKKLVDRVCEGEDIKLEEKDKDKFAEFANGDCRRLLNGMELCFKNNTIVDDSQKMSEMIEQFIHSDESSIQRMKYSSLSTEKILHNLIHTIIQKDGIPLDVLPYIQSDTLTLCAQLYQTYPDLVRHDINGTDQMNALAEAADNISYTDVFIDDMIRANGHDDCFTFSDNHVIQGLIIPLSKLRLCIPKTFKMDIAGYAKLFGLSTSIESQETIKLKIQNSSPFFRNKTFEEIRYTGSAIAKMLQDEKYDELAKIFHDNNVDPEIIDEFEKIRLLKDHNESRYFGVELKDVWKNAHKRKLKKQFKEDTPVVQGVKFKDDKVVTKIDFFGKYEKSNKKLKSSQ